MLQTTLARDGVSLAFSNLSNSVPALYLDVANNRIGINTDTPTVALQVNGNIIANNLSAVANVTANTISASGNVAGGNLTTVGQISATGNVTANVLIANDAIIENVNIGNIVNGGNLVVDSVTANLYISTVGNVTAGNVLIGNILLPSVGNIDVGNTVIANLAEPQQDSDAVTKFYVDNIAGNITNFGNLTANDTTISTSTANANIIIDPNGIGQFQIVGTNGFVIPSGTTAERPSSPQNATLRFNTDTQSLEVYDSVEAAWDTVVSDITNQVIVPDGTNASYTLDKTTTAPSIIVSINGLVQIPGPGYSYTVSGNVITFADVPLTTDIIDIRFL